jgi:rsbT co-antagonist protein RsbR
MAEERSLATEAAGATAPMAKLLRADAQRVLDRWVELVAGNVRGRITERELRAELAELFDLLVRALDDGDGAERGELRAALAEISRGRARQGFSPTETAVGVFALKQAVLEAIEADGAGYAGFVPFSAFMDDLGLATFETYAAEREQVIADQAEQLLELSTPVVKLWDGILGVPLVGTLDSARTQVVMESLLQMLVDTGSQYAVIDITGVPAVDTEVAQHLLKTVMAARLMGTDCVISGIRPQIAQTIVGLGIEFGDIVTKATLADALAYTLRRSGVTIEDGV